VSNIASIFGVYSLLIWLDATSDSTYSVEAMKALFSFITVLVPLSTPATVPLKSAGLLASLMPVITTTTVDPTMQPIVLKCLETLEVFLDYDDSAAVELFRDLGGVTELVKRIAVNIRLCVTDGFSLKWQKLMNYEKIRMT
jgi:hypothetical protein